MAKILIVEDDENLQLLMEARLEDEYTVYKAGNGLDALGIIEDEKIDLIIADIMMPKMDGYQFVAELRDRGFQTPVIMATAKQELSDKRDGFKVGADDYMTKPIVFDELKWRVEALLRRSKIAKDKEIVIGAFRLNATTHEALHGDKSIELTAKEFELLFKLLSYPNKLFTKEKLMEDIWGYDTESDDTTIRTHFNRLRNKLEGITEFEIVTIRGIGYKAVIKDKK